MPVYALALFLPSIIKEVSPRDQQSEYHSSTHSSVYHIPSDSRHSKLTVFL